jgi:group II intron reverse transcriptase/maturase
VSTRQQRLAELAQQAPQLGFTTLNHYLDLPWLLEAYRRTRKDGAAGVDGQTAADYEADLRGNLQGLVDRAKSGTYRAPPVRRVHIPKGTGGNETRPLGIPTFEDKVLQRAAVMVLEAIYEQDFYPCSYGFRPGRSAHQALRDLWQQTMQTGGGWVLDVDIRKFFDTLDHAQLRNLLRRRVRDGVLLRLIDKWLGAGVLEAGSLSYPEAGTPQGGVISPLLANVYLHYVLDEWFEREVKPRLRGRAFLIRYADDFVIGFTDESDARRVLEVLPKRFGKYGLTLHPAKTRLVPFRRPPQRPTPGARAQERPGTFDFLGFTHCDGPVAAVAVAPLVGGAAVVGRLQAAVGAPGAAGAAGRPLGSLDVAKRGSRRAVCLSRASTDLWEARGATPGPTRRRNRREVLCRLGSENSGCVSRRRVCAPLTPA